MSDDNIIRFPKMKLNSPPQSMEEVSERVNAFKTAYSDEISEMMWNNILTDMSRDGIDFESNFEEYAPSMILLLESIKALHLRANGIDHPLQEFADEAFTDDDIDEIIDYDDEFE